jgi:hypothetical protein
MMSLQDNPGRANAAGLIAAAASGLALRWKRAQRPIGVRLKFVLFLFKMRKVCDGSRNGDKGSRSFGKRADVGAYRGKPRGDSRRKAGSFATGELHHHPGHDRRPFTFG